MIPGKIVIGIDEKVYFEYYKLKIPNDSLYYKGGNEYYEQMDKHKASKQLIEVSNVYYKDDLEEDFIEIGHGLSKGLIKIKDSQPCKAEVTGKICTIVELIK